MSTIKVYTGRLGWSNQRSGVEFYMHDRNANGRHERDWAIARGRDPGWGHLLVDDIDPGMTAEGRSVIVVVLPGRGDDPAPVEQVVREALEA